VTTVPGSVTVRAERPDDIEVIRRVNDSAFGDPKNHGIVDGIRGTDRWIEGGSLVAEDTEGRIVGHLLLSEGDLEMPDGVTVRIWMIGPVAVIPERQRQGIGSALMRASIDLATEWGQPVLCLLGHADYYPRFGFRSARSLGIEPPRPWGDEHWMALPLPAWDGSLQGVARFPAAFPDSQ
jgi:putative acetyltransferase